MVIPIVFFFFSVKIKCRKIRRNILYGSPRLTNRPVIKSEGPRDRHYGNMINIKVALGLGSEIGRGRFPFVSEDEYPYNLTSGFRNPRRIRITDSKSFVVTRLSGESRTQLSWSERGREVSLNRHGPRVGAELSLRNTVLRPLHKSTF